MRKAIIIVTLVFTCCALYADGKIKVAIAEFSGKDISASDAVAVSEFFRTALVNTNSVSVLDRNNMDMILAEQKFQSTGCTDQDCVVKMGKMLNVEKIIVGNVIYFESKYYINVQVIDVESGEIKHSDRILSKDKESLPLKAEQLAEITAFRLTGVKPEVNNLPFDFETAKSKRKAFCVYVAAFTQMFEMGSSSIITPQFSLVTDKATIPSIVPGVGIRAYPYKRLFFDVGALKDIQPIGVHVVKASNALGNNGDYIQEIEIYNNYYATLNYVLKDGDKFKYSFGVGAYLAQFHTISNNSDYYLYGFSEQSCAAALVAGNLDWEPITDLKLKYEIF